KLSLDPKKVSNDPALLAKDRRFSGPVFTFQSIIPNFIALPYIDRFSRVEDFNLGRTFSFSLQAAPKFFGSKENAFLFTSNFSKGSKLTSRSFVRGEIGLSTRLQKGDFENSLFRAEGRYYNVLGKLGSKNFNLGKHTLAAGWFLEYGVNLDKDRELLIGADNALRGYKARSFTGNKRTALMVEDRIHLIENILDLFSLGLAVFADVGGSTTKPISKLFSDSMYGDFGLGLRIGFLRSSGERVLRIDLAVPWRDAPDGTSQFEPRLTVSVGQIFSALLGTELKGAEKASVDIGFDK
ncbi:MAG: hypothetical protein D6780_02795, partial [Candidatus Dadabacteria bacterium]